MPRQRQRRREAATKTVPLIPIALALAIWLGLAATIAGLSGMARTTPAMSSPSPALFTVSH